MAARRSKTKSRRAAGSHPRGPDGRFLSKAQIAARKGWETRRRRRAAAAEKQPPPPPRRAASRPRDERGRFLSRTAFEEREKREARRRAALKAAETRRRRKAERLAQLDRERAEKERRAKRRRAAARKGWETRRKREAEKRERYERAVQTRKRAELAKKRRSEAAKLGWEKRRQRKLQAALEEAQQARAVLGPGPGPEVRSLFTDPRWLDGSWHVFDDGSMQGQIIVPPGGDPRSRFIELEQAIAPTVESAPSLWVQAGVQARPPNLDDAAWDRYDKYGGSLVTLTYPRRSENTAAVFVGAREIADNLLGAGFKLTGLIVRVTFGPRPDRR